MIKHTKVLIMLSLSLVLIGESVSTMAAEATFTAPPKANSKPANVKLTTPFMQVGVVKRLAGAENQIIISGKKYFYNLNTKFQSDQSKFLSVQLLKVDDKVGIDYILNKDKQRILTKVQVLSVKLSFPLVLDQ